MRWVDGRLKCLGCKREKAEDREYDRKKEREANAKAKEKKKEEAESQAQAQAPPPYPGTPWTPPPIQCRRCQAIFETVDELHRHYYPTTPLVCYSHCTCFVGSLDALNHAHEKEHWSCFFQDCPSHHGTMPGGNEGVIQHILDYHTPRSEPAVPSAEEKTKGGSSPPERKRSSKKKKKKTTKTTKKGKVVFRKRSRSRREATHDSSSSSESEYGTSSEDSDSDFSWRSRDDRHHPRRGHSRGNHRRRYDVPPPQERNVTYERRNPFRLFWNGRDYEDPRDYGFNSPYPRYDVHSGRYFSGGYRI